MFGLWPFSRTIQRRTMLINTQTRISPDRRQSAIPSSLGQASRRPMWPTWALQSLPHCQATSSTADHSKQDLLHQPREHRGRSRRSRINVGASWMSTWTALAMSRSPQSGPSRPVRPLSTFRYQSDSWSTHLSLSRILPRAASTKRTAKRYVNESTSQTAPRWSQVNLPHLSEQIALQAALQVYTTTTWHDSQGHGYTHPCKHFEQRSCRVTIASQYAERLSYTPAVILATMTATCCLCRFLFPSLRYNLYLLICTLSPVHIGVSAEP